MAWFKLSVLLQLRSEATGGPYSLLHLSSKVPLPDACGPTPRGKKIYRSRSGTVAISSSFGSSGVRVNVPHGLKGAVPSQECPTQDTIQALFFTSNISLFALEYSLVNRFTRSEQPTITPYLSSEISPGISASNMGSIGETQDPPPFQPPPFEPPLAVLKTQAATIQAAVAEYELAKTPDDKARAVINIAVASQMLSTITTSPGAVVQRFAFQPVSNAAVRVAIGMGLFNQLSPSKPATTKELAAKCNSDAEFVQRIARAVASLGMLQEVSEETYAHTPISMILSDDTAQASLARKSSRAYLTADAWNDCSPLH